MKNFIDYYLLVAESEVITPNDLVTHHDSSSTPFTVQYKTIGNRISIMGSLKKEKENIGKELETKDNKKNKEKTGYWVNFGNSNGTFPKELWTDLTPLKSDTPILTELSTPYSSIGGLRDVLGQITRKNVFYVVEVYFPTEGNKAIEGRTRTLTLPPKKGEKEGEKLQVIPVRAFYGTEEHLKQI